MWHNELNKYASKKYSRRKATIARQDSANVMWHTFVCFLVCPDILILQCWRASLAMSEMNICPASEISRTLQATTGPELPSYKFNKTVYQSNSEVDKEAIGLPRILSILFLNIII